MWTAERSTPARSTQSGTPLGLSENAGRNIGLPLPVVMTALAAAVSSPRFAALTLTEVNPRHGEPDGATLARLVDGLVQAFADLGRGAGGHVIAGV